MDCDFLSEEVSPGSDEEDLVIPGQLLVQGHVQRVSHGQGLHHGWAGGGEGPSSAFK